MRHGAAWYKRYAAEFLAGIVGMTPRQIAVYSIILDLLYQHGGEIRKDPKWIGAPIRGLGVSKVASTIEELIDLGKLELSGTGGLTHHRVRAECKTREETSGRRSDAGKKAAGVPKPRTMFAIVDGGKADPPTKPEEREKIEREFETPAPDDTLRERIRLAMGYDKTGLTANGNVIGSLADMKRVARWMQEYDLTEDEVVEVVADAVSRTRETVRSFRYFDGPMESYAADRDEPMRKGGKDDARRPRTKPKADEGWD